MDKQHKNPDLSKLFSRILLLLVMFECTALLGMLLTDHDEQLEQIRTQVSSLHGDASATEYIKQYNSWRIGPYQNTRLIFQDKHQQELQVQASHWWGFSPTIHCVSSATKATC